ncbi:gamma-glutamyl-gamma-aminobutyrate hydrolase family protein [Rhodoferax sp.]|uniref:gamma-glutamyl-gamma-aminobutyrate hydrolase family protein n=1 Tax=Rhodoferax sp. TaxID=50421 RepID=UPI00284AF616|nr:gamma-glutamyl-gamma-aminobutyrate hydrolase family protein [Rhodoferax sp.]MDR3371869.1 gamma-glutamyl-gamma-aminobutyrate hydrolase family protein [Rhodoferax sp.]
MDKRTPTATVVAAKPKVLVPACLRQFDGQPYLVVGQKYLDAVELAGCQPWIFSGSASSEIDAVLSSVDGVLLTGSPSNVHPSHYGQQLLDPASPQDARRDAWVLPLIRLAIKRGTPVLGICRGFQEINIAMGGSLHQAVHQVAGCSDHRAPKDAPAEEVYGPAHEVHLCTDGAMHHLMGTDRIMVNSIHEQGLPDLGQGLRVEAQALDGLVEAFSAPDAAGFLMAVQWHPEWRATDNPASQKLFAAFGDACRASLAQRLA